MVFYDKAGQGAVSNLAVKCSKMRDGCSWQGSLHELEKHVNDCYFHNKSNSVYQEHIKNQLRVLEETIIKKDQEFFDLKNQNSNLEQEFIAHKKEITNLTNNINARLNEILATNKDLTMRVQQFEKLKIGENIVGNSYDKNTSLPGSSLLSPCQKISGIPSDKRLTTPIVKLSTASSPKSSTTISNSRAPFIKPLTASCSSTKPFVQLTTASSVKHLSTPSNATLGAVQLSTTQSNSAIQSVQLLNASSVKHLVTTSASTTPFLANTLSSSNNSIPQVVQYPAVSWNHFDEPDWGGELEDWEFDYFVEKMDGYDADFVNEVPLDLECSICLFVVREPVQILACGHRFCSHCFENLKKLPADRLRCPKDNASIDPNKVFPDTAALRTVFNLTVRCSKTGEGCLWQGALRELENHLKDCSFNNPKNLIQKHMLNQISALEEAFKKKDQEYLHLKNQNFRLEQEFIKFKKEMENFTTSTSIQLDELLVSFNDLSSRIQQIEKIINKRVKIL
ncbi:uncharacterized protein LOC136084827 [Hydra vulgaris]|uniref:Uncharacterized protein LOC136084827 n=1 Tax=Hydra vulgaris TaxID=6087 RepID=A0ABM4CJM9_HYDVU